MLGIKAHEFDLLEARVLFGGQHDARAACEVREQASCLRDGAFKSPLVGGGACVGLDPCPLLAGEAAELQQGVDIEAQAELGGQAPGAGVRCVDQAEFFEILHDVADRRRRKRDRQQLGDHARADGFAVAQVAVDDPTENFARASVEHRERSRFGGPFKGRGHGRNLTRKGRRKQGAPRRLPVPRPPPARSFR